MFAATSLILALAASSVSAYPIPIDPNVIASVETAVNLPNTTQINNASYYYQNGNAGACGWYSTDSDVVVGLPLEFYNNTGSMSPYCGSYVVVTNLANNMTVTSRVADASATPEFLSLSIATFRALDGDASDLKTVSWRFANATEVAAAVAASSSTTIAAPTVASTPAASTSSTPTTTVVSTSSSPAAQAYTAPSSSAKPYTAPSSAAAPTVVAAASVKPASSYSSSSAKASQSSSSSSSSSSGSGSYSGQATYYYQGGNAGACGEVSSDSDYVVAIDSAMYDGGSHCGQMVQIYANGKSVTAKVADECPTCASSGSLDLSVGAFNQIASESAGTASITWSFV